MRVRCVLCGESLNPTYVRYRRNQLGEYLHEGCAQKVQRQMALGVAIVLSALVLLLSLL